MYRRLSILGRIESVLEWADDDNELLEILGPGRQSNLVAHSVEQYEPLKPCLCLSALLLITKSNVPGKAYEPRKSLDHDVNRPAYTISSAFSIHARWRDPLV